MDARFQAFWSVCQPFRLAGLRLRRLRLGGVWLVRGAGGTVIVSEETVTVSRLRFPMALCWWSDPWFDLLGSRGRCDLLVHTRSSW